MNLAAATPGHTVVMREQQYLRLSVDEGLLNSLCETDFKQPHLYHKTKEYQRIMVVICLCRFVGMKDTPRTSVPGVRSESIESAYLDL